MDHRGNSRMMKQQGVTSPGVSKLGFIEGTDVQDENDCLQKKVISGAQPKCLTRLRCPVFTQETGED